MSPRFRRTLAAIAAVAAGIRLFRLDHFSYGLDEILQAYWIHGSWRHFWGALRFDAVHPPLDYLIGKILETVHPVDAVRKLPSVAWAVGTVATFGVLLARRAGETAGLCGAALLAFAPFHVRYAQELRPYSLSLLLLCLSLLALDRLLENPGWARLAAAFLACLATAYTLYAAALVLGIAAAGLLIEDAFSLLPARRRAARRFLAMSPLFLFLLWLCYLPWWSVLIEASRRPAMAARAPLSLSRAGRTLSFFAFAPDDGHPLGRAGLLFLILALAGVGIALSRRGLRFLLAWGPGGLAAIEALGQIHPHFDVSRRFLPAGLAVIALVSLPLAAMIARPTTRAFAALVLCAVLALDARGLRAYFRDGRADWRPLADHLRREARPGEKIFTENQYSQLCVAFYLEGPQWLELAMTGGKPAWDFPNLDGDAGRLNAAWTPGTRAWLVLAGVPSHEPLHRWAEGFPSVSFPTAEHAVLHRLDPELRGSALAAPR